MRSAPEPYYDCPRCGQRNWPGRPCTSCYHPDPDKDGYNRLV